MSFGKQLFNSYLWQLVGSWITRSLGLVSTLLLVRILTPDDFGIAAQSMMVIMFFKAISQSGAGDYIIKLKNPTESDLLSAWTLNFISRTALILLMFFTSEPIANFLGDERLIPVLQITCITAIISTFNSPKLILLQKNMEFKRLSIFNVWVKVISFVATIALAIYLENYWALIWGNFIGALAGACLSYVFAPAIPKIHTQNIKAQLNFAKGMLGMSVFGYLRSKAEIFIVSSKFGSSSVGHYSVAQEFSLLPLSEIISPLMAPLYSSLAKLDASKSDLEDKLYKYLSLSYLFIFPCILGIFLLSNEIVTIVLGVKWLEAAPVLANLSLLMLVYVTNGTFKHAFILKESFKGIILIDILGLILILSVLFVDNISDISTFSLYRALVGAVVMLCTLIAIKVWLRFKLIQFYVCITIPALGCMAMYIGLALFNFYTTIDNIYLFTIGNVAIGALIYISTVIVLIKLFKNKNKILHFNYSFIKKSISQVPVISKLNY